MEKIFYAYRKENMTAASYMLFTSITEKADERYLFLFRATVLLTNTSQYCEMQI